MRKEWLAYGSDTRRAATAFVSGTNEHVRLACENPETSRAAKEPRPRAEGLRAEVEALRKPLDLVLIPAAVLGVYELATAPVEFLGVQPPAMVQEDSNNRATPPGQAATGRPILADDPECAHSVPSPRYAVHLSSAGMDVIFQRPAGCSPT